MHRLLNARCPSLISPSIPSSSPGRPSDGGYGQYQEKKRYWACDENKWVSTGYFEPLAQVNFGHWPQDKSNQQGCWAQSPFFEKITQKAEKDHDLYVK